jgi:hypothetical protein
MGVVAFLMGDGKYGVFEILKHVIPGLLCDALVPIIARRAYPKLHSSSEDSTPKIPGPIAWSVLGGVIAAGRFATIFGITLAVQAPAIAFALLVPGLTIHITFGVVSGYVTYPIVRALRGLRPQPDVPEEPAVANQGAAEPKARRKEAV